MKKLVGIWLMLLLPWLGAAQQTINLEGLSKQKPLKITGGLNLSTVGNYGLPTIGSKTNLFASGSLNFNIFNTVSVPVSFNYSDRKIALSQGYSFNQIGISPTYKWATAHIGTTFMNFSPYTLNGHQAMGGGLELTPDKWQIKLIAGRLRKSQSVDSLITGPTFKRMAYGSSIQYNPGKFVAGLNVLKSSDLASSLPTLNRKFGNNLVNPEDNLVLSFNFGTTLFHALQLNVEYANSIITRSTDPLNEAVKIKSLAGFLSKTNATSQSFNAFKSSINYHIAKTNSIIGLGYERVDPDYRTHGGYYFVNDVINYTANVMQPFWNKKLTLNANVGVQQDNIDKAKATTGNRLVGSINLNAQPNEMLRFGLNYSNFQGYMFVNDLYKRITQVPGQPIDSLNFSMISQNLGLNINKTFRKSDDFTDGILLTSTYLVSQNRQENLVDLNSKTNVLNNTLQYTLQNIQSKFGASAGMNLLINEFGTSILRGFGPTVSMNKTFADGKANANITGTWLRTVSKGVELPTVGSSATNFTIGASYQPYKKHRINFSSGMVKNSLITPYVNAVLGYNYAF